MLCYAGTSTDRAQETLDVIIAEMQRLGREGIEPEELETMRAGLKSSLIMAQESSMSRSSALASDWYFLGRVRPLEEISSELDALTPRSVSDYATGFVHLRDLTILTLGPTALRFPLEAEV
jgi:predicted Zn-dependent peptidase